MDENQLVRFARELSHFLVDFSNDIENVKSGDWKAVKNNINDGDMQIRIYRNITEIIFVYNGAGSVELEVDISLRKQADPLLYKGVIDFLKDKNIPYSDNIEDNSFKVSFKFEKSEELRDLIYTYILPLGYK
ncbi:hypothetical protein [Guptibacillus spartinae]|uniref:hypothetical protein n=1 Tax=Guptibacillus spartinae TaxID=3025679 RepID=UPI00235E7E2E|nr:hypothetical protein [Pseudalkalibacillus spartinae]